MTLSARLYAIIAACALGNTLSVQVRKAPVKLKFTVTVDTVTPGTSVRVDREHADYLIGDGDDKLPKICSMGAHQGVSPTAKCQEAMSGCIFGCDTCQSICYPCSNLYLNFKCDTLGVSPEQVSYAACRNIDYACSSTWGSDCQGKDAEFMCNGWKGVCIQYSDNVTAGCDPLPKNVSKATKNHVATKKKGEPKWIGYALQVLSGLVNLLFLQSLLRENWKKWRENGADGAAEAEAAEEGDVDPDKVDQKSEDGEEGDEGDGDGEGEDGDEGEEAGEDAGEDAGEGVADIAEDLGGLMA